MRPEPILGILAGRGELPRRLIRACRDRGRPVFVIVFEGQTDPETVELAGPDHARVRLGAAGRAIDCLHQAGVGDLVMAGAIVRPSLSALRPDWRAAAFLARTGVMGRGDDGLLAALIRELESREGFRVVGAETLLPDVLAPTGVWGRVTPDVRAGDDIRLGIEVARTLGALDVGQGAVVQQGLVLAVEAIEGTDAMLSRCAALARDGPGGVLVKVCKPGQEIRTDRPTLGPRTVEAAAAAGLRGIAVEAGGAIVVDRDGVVAAADRLGLFVIGVEVDAAP